MKKFRPARAKGTFVLGIWCSLCGFLDSITKRFIIDSNNEYKSSFTEKVIANWTAFSSDSLERLENTTLASYIHGCKLADRHNNLKSVPPCDKESIEEKRRVRELASISDEIKAVCAEIECCSDDAKNSMKKAAAKYQKILVAYFAGFRKGKQYSFTRRIFITDEADSNQDFEAFCYKIELLKKSI